MRTRTGTWFETKIKFEEVQTDGNMKSAKETYVVDAYSYTEAEKAIMEEVSSCHSAFEVVDMKKPSYKEIFFSDEARDDKWYKAKLQFITLDEKTEKEKRQNVYYLVQAGTLFRAVQNIDAVMSKGMIDYNIASVAETSIMDVFEHKVTYSDDKPEVNDVPEYEQAPAE